MLNLSDSKCICSLNAYDIAIAGTVTVASFVSVPIEASAGLFTLTDVSACDVGDWSAVGMGGY